MISKGLFRFKHRMARFRTDLELVTMLSYNKERLKGEKEYLFVNLNETRTPLLTKFENSKLNRALVVGHLRKTFMVSFLKEMYEEVTIFMHYMLYAGCVKCPDIMRLTGEHNISFKASEVLRLHRENTLETAVAESIFRALENERSTVKLIAKINEKMGLGVLENEINAAMPYLECRHVFIHRDGKPDDLFKEKYPDIFINEKGKIALNDAFIKIAYESVWNMVAAFDSAMIAKHLYPKNEIQPPAPRIR